MVFLEVCYQSDVLGMQMQMNVLLPETAPHQPPKECPVLYLLHGMSYDHTSWMRWTSIERYAGKYGYAVIMPDTHLAWYTDMKYGLKYWTHLTEELPKIVHRFFPHITEKREKTFVAGLSMGAYGALKCGILLGDRFACVGGLSSPPDMLDHMRNPNFPPEEIALYHDIYGTEEEYIGSINDLYAQAAIHGKDAVRPRFYMSCGTSDVYLPLSRSMKDALFATGYDLTYREMPGDHNWEFWDAEIQSFLAFTKESAKGDN
ncbi:MAG: esterase family protein [Clostridia bacterium]|nr:esterase family protein [Clostridia bacterium]